MNTDAHEQIHNYTNMNMHVHKHDHKRTETRTQTMNKHTHQHDKTPQHRRPQTTANNSNSDSSPEAIKTHHLSITIEGRQVEWRATAAVRVVDVGPAVAQ